MGCKESMPVDIPTYVERPVRVSDPEEDDPKGWDWEIVQAADSINKYTSVKKDDFGVYSEICVGKVSYG